MVESLIKPHRGVERLLDFFLTRIRKIERYWKKVREVRAVMRPAWFATLMSVVVFAALQIAQARDILVEIASKGVFQNLRDHATLLIAALVASTTAWYFSRALLYVEYPRFTPPNSEQRYERWRRWHARLVGSLPLLALAVASWRSGLTGYGFFYLAVFALFLIALWVRRVLLYGSENEIRLHESLKAAGATTYWITLGLLSVSGLLLVVFLNSKVQAPQFIGPLGILLVAAAIWIAFGSTAVYLSSRYTIPSIVGLLLLLALVFSIWNDNHQVRTLAGERDADDAEESKRLADEVGKIAARPSLDAHFIQWLDVRRSGWAERTAEPFPVVVVAAEGGGIRAAYWTATVLARLDHEIPGFSCHVYAISGVSGGSLGGAVYSALLADRLANDPDYVCDGAAEEKSTPKILSDAEAVLGENFLGPALAGLLFPDLIQRFWPIPGRYALSFPDRARYLERAWEAGWKKATGNDRFASDFLDLWQGELQGREEGAGAVPLLYQVPSLLLNGTWVETGGRTVTSNLVMEGGPSSRSVQLEDLLGEVGQGIPLSTAVHMSARFTYVSPAGTIETEAGVRRIVDGGYFENSGGLTAAEIVETLADHCGKGECGLEIEPIALYIKNGPAEIKEIADSNIPLYETLSPARALLNTRGARGRHSEALLRKSTRDPASAERLKCPPEKSQGPFLHYCLEQDEDVAIPLGWVLSGPVRQQIQKQLEQLQHLDTLKGYILDPKPAPRTKATAETEA